jgi:hypothetical protein
MEYNIKMDLTETGCGLDSAGSGYSKRVVFVTTVMNITDSMNQNSSCKASKEIHRLL